MLVLNSIGEREHLCGADFLLIVDGGSRADFGDQVIYHGDFDHIAVFVNLNGIDSLVFQIASRRSKLAHGIAAVDNILKGEDAIVVRLSSQQRVILGEAGFVCTEEAEQSARNLVAGFTVDLIALDDAVDQLIGDFLAAVRSDVDGGSFLACVVKHHRILFIGENVMAVCADFFHIGLSTNRKVCAESRMTVLITRDNLKPPASGDAAAICGNDFLGGEQAKVDGCDFAIIANAEDFILLHDLIQINLNLLTVIVEACGSLCDLNFLTCVGQLHGLNDRVDCHAVRSFCLNDTVLAQE